MTLLLMQQIIFSRDPLGLSSLAPVVSLPVEFSSVDHCIQVRRRAKFLQKPMRWV